MELKICRTCTDEKNIKSFHRDNKSPDGHASQCKDCRNTQDRNKRKHEADPVEINDQILSKIYARLSALERKVDTLEDK